MHIQDLKDMIASKLDVIEFLDILGFTMYDLVDVLEPVIKENEPELLRAIDEQ
jgi:hypothetical protein